MKKRTKYKWVKKTWYYYINILENKMNLLLATRFTNIWWYVLWNSDRFKCSNNNNRFSVFDVIVRSHKNDKEK